MVRVSVDEISRDPARFISKAEAGETILVTRADQPVAEIRPVDGRTAGKSASLRPWGLAAGEFRVPDDFDAPLPTEVLDAFEGR
jgi:antitoxin (DNA-binding transcriptional repressor) of toxin-antitoxin stability system